jgi:protocatechuate 3,4-dioxygenase beta subunit
MIRAAQLNSQSANMSLDDDLPVGTVLSRRDAVRLLAVSGAAVLAGCRTGNGSANAGSTTAASTAQGAAASLPSCVAKPELTVGPYFVDRQLERSDIRIEPATNAIKDGAPLHLTFNVKQIANGQCTPLPGAMVDVWQCDADGSYSGVNDQTVGFNTEGQQFLRGYQVTDANGVARFVTIYPGWYRGRAVHIHFKVRTPADAVAGNRTESVYEFTSQLFFDESLTDRVHAQAPYAAKGQRDRRNENDGIYRQAGDTLLLAVAAAGDGYDANFDMGLDLSDSETGRPDGMQRGRPGGPGGGRPPG